jgi:hypothetical protein
VDCGSSPLVVMVSDSDTGELTGRRRVGLIFTGGAKLVFGMRQGC